MHPLIRRLDHTDQVIEHLAAARQSHRQPCQEQPRVKAASVRLSGQAAMSTLRFVHPDELPRCGNLWQ